jgi:hypothetical protein
MAGIIDIGVGGACKSKVKRAGGELSQIFANYEAAPEADILDNVDTVVQCSADCIFNVNSMCGLEAINIEDGLVKTKCMTRKRT